MKHLDEIQKETVLEDGQKLLAESRQLGEAKDSFMLARYLPFRMFCETQYGKKEGYPKLIRQFQKIKENDYDRMLSGACQGKRQESRELACFLTACADTLEEMSMKIYEHYRYLEDLIRMTARDLKNAGFFCQNGGKCPDGKTQDLFETAILKGCRLKALSQEKYEPLFCKGGNEHDQQKGL